MKKHKTRNTVKTLLLAITLALTMLFPASASAASKPVPSKVTVTKAQPTAYNKIKVSWKKGKNATHYKVYYRKYGTKTWNHVATVKGSASSYTHTSNPKAPIVVGQKYSYTVKGYNSKYKTNGKYDTKGKTTATKPSTVKLQGAYLNDDKTQVTIKWNGAKGGDSYKIYRRTGSSNWKNIATVKSDRTSYTDKNPVPGTTNVYTVRAYNSKTKAYGNYNTKGVSVFVPKKSADKPDKPVKVSDVHISPTTHTSLKIGESITLTASVSPSNATNKTVTWSIYSGGEDIVKIEPQGNTVKVTAIGYGHARVRAKANGAYTGLGFNACSINVEVDPDVYAKQVMELCNKERAKLGLQPFKFHQKLQDAAMLRAKELEIIYSHGRPNGLDGTTAGAEMGVSGVVGENIAMGQPTPQVVVSDWMKSSGHRAPILNEYNRYMGVGFHKGKDGVYYWVQLFSIATNPDSKSTITFDATGGTGGCTLTLPNGTYLFLQDCNHPIYGFVKRSECVPVPTREGYTFLYWNSEYGNKIVATGVHDQTLYAVWKKN